MSLASSMPWGAGQPWPRRRFLAGMVAATACRPPRSPRRAPPTVRTIDAHRQRLRTLSLPDWGRLRFVDEGRGPAIMLVHGVPTSSWLYRHMIDALVARGFRVVAPDLIGFGASDKPRNPALLTADRQGQRLHTLATALGLREWTQVCHDAGGPWTWEMLRLGGPQPRRLAVLNTIAYAEGWHPPIRLREGGRLGHSARRNLVRQYIGRRAVKLILNAGTSQRGLFDDPNVIDGYWRSMPEGTANAVVSFMEHLDRLETRLPVYQHALRNYLGRATIIWGANDDILDGQRQVPPLAKALAVAPADVHVLPQRKHFLQEEDPDQLVELLTAFVARWP
ncbi:MAG: alpha/beta fold hydrolase [Myxococcales bacterium FL481]|nr:MAG: alpha/beta fold hydrolase [Myxococcales bacterium FL481]